MLGQTGESLSVVGFGGVLVWDEEPTTAGRLVAQAVDRGINYFDVAPTYGNAQERLGPALKPFRQDVFLACKTIKRSRRTAWDELHESLRLLGTDHFDLYQLHAINSADDVAQALGPDGALEALLTAREQGLTRFLGFSSHSEEAAQALMDQFAFDTVLYPFNWVCWHQGGLGPQVLTKAGAKQMGILCLKALARRKLAEGEVRTWPKCWYDPVGTREEANRAARFSLSLPITAMVCPGHPEHLWWMCEAAENFQPLSPQEDAALARDSAGLEPVFRNASQAQPA
jgi:aryl-alcohol dehydrogenase-like predicted oxidoreductase